MFKNKVESLKRIVGGIYRKTLLGNTFYNENLSFNEKSCKLKANMTKKCKKIIHS